MKPMQTFVSTSEPSMTSLTSMASQMDSMSFLKEGSTKRKEIIAKFLDLQIFDQKYKLARKDAADLRGVIKRMKAKSSKNNSRRRTIFYKIFKKTLMSKISKIYNCSIERLESELAEINETINAIPAEIIDILTVQQEIAFKRVKKPNFFVFLLIKRASKSLKNT